MVERVHFYSAGDLSAYLNLQKAAQVIGAYSDKEPFSDINDVIELYHVWMFVDNGVTLREWDEGFVAKAKCFNRVVSDFFKAIASDKFIETYNSVEFDYKESFWNIIEGFNIIDVLTVDNLVAVCRGDKFTLRDVLRCKRIVKRFNKTLAELFKEDEDAAEWLLDYHVARQDLGSGNPIVIPPALSLEDKENIINDYLSRGSDANLNYVQLVINTKDDKNNFVLSPKTRLKAKRLEDKLLSRIFKPGMGVHIRTIVEMSREEGIPPVCSYKNGEGDIVRRYDANLIDKLDFSDLIFYFQFGFEYLSKMSFINLISMSSQESVMERLTGLSARNAYRENIDFRIKDQRSLVQMLSMVTTLKHTGRRVEDAIKHFYEVFLKEKYGYPSRQINIPSENSTYVEKFRTLAPEMDAVVKQFNLYSKERDIDPGLLAMESSIKVTDSNSCVDRKYFVVNESSTDLKSMFCLIFGDQSMHYHSFFELLRTNKPIDCSKYEKWQLDRLQPLIDKGLVRIGGDSMLRVLDWAKILILQHLYKYKACSFWYYPSDMRDAVLEMEKAGWVSCCNKLLTPEEQNYFSFILNDERYTNAYSIRNLYAHGGNAPADDEKLHEVAYARLLIMFVLLLLKIDDDLSIKTAVERRRC